MKKKFKAIIAFLVISSSSASFAYTECTDVVVTSVLYEDTRTFGRVIFLGLNDSSMANGYMSIDDAVVSILLKARTEALPVRVRYESQDIDCNFLPNYQERIRAIGF